MLLLIVFSASLGAEPLVPLPSTLDNLQLGVGDMYPMAARSHVSFRIWVIQQAGQTQTDATGQDSALDRRTLKQFTVGLNKRLQYLSGGHFTLRLRQIRFVSVQPGSLTELEHQIVAHADGQSFAMIIGPHYDGGSYVGHGVFKIASEEIAVKPFNRKALHEILHALISPAHSTSRSSTLEQYNPVIGLDAQEAHFLGWPERPAVSPDSSLFD